MAATIIDGTQLARSWREQIAADAATWTAEAGRQPCLQTILVGDDPASSVYIGMKRRACAEVGIRSQHLHLPSSSTVEEICGAVADAGADPQVDGILVQFPLPDGIDTDAVIAAIAPSKDVDCFHPQNVGLLANGRPGALVPCTPAGIMRMLDAHDVTIAGAHAVVVGRSSLVGRPAALMLLDRDATVTIAHSRTADLASITTQADILIVAVGRAGLIDASMVKPGAVVIDVGINRTDAGLVGDVDFDAVKQVAGLITPVPGGVGPMTVATLMANTVAAARVSTL